MSVLEFIAAVVGSLAWPVVVLVMVWVLRQQIRDFATKLVGRFAELAEMSAMGVSLKFNKQLNEVVREAERVAAEAASSRESATANTAQREGSATAEGEGSATAEGEGSATAEGEGSATAEGEGSAEQSGAEPEQPIPSEEPLVTLLEAYRDMEMAVSRALERRGLTNGKRPSSLRVGIRKLLSDSILDRSIIGIADSLVNLRNEAVHSRVRVDADDAERFALAAHEVIRYVNTK